MCTEWGSTLVRLLAHRRGRQGQRGLLAIFQRLKPLAPEYGIRLVLVNRRDYPGSSPYADEEIQSLRTGGDEAHKKFNRKRAEEFATFLSSYIKNERIPPTSAEGGGLALLGWSSANVLTIALLANLDQLPEHQKNDIEPYLRSFIIFGN